MRTDGDVSDTPVHITVIVNHNIIIDGCHLLAVSTKLVHLEASYRRKGLPS